MHLVGFIIRKYHDARSYECQIQNETRVRGTCTTIFSLPAVF